MFGLLYLVNYGSTEINIFFKEGVIDPSKVFTLAQLNVWSWVTSKTVSASFTYSEWRIDPRDCMFSIK